MITPPPPPPPASATQRAKPDRDCRQRRLRGNLTNWRAFGTGPADTYVYRHFNYDSKSDTLAVGLVRARRLGDVRRDQQLHSTASVLQFGLANNNSNPDASLLTGAPAR